MFLVYWYTSVYKYSKKIENQTKPNSTMDTRAHVDVAAPTDTSQPRPSPALEPSQLCQTTKTTHSHPKASGSDAAAPAHRPPTAEHPDTALVLDIVAAHLAPNQDGVRTAIKLECTCTAWRGVGATVRTAFASAHDALLDQQLSSLCHESFSDWLVGVLRNSDQLDENKRGFESDDIRHTCILLKPVMARHAFDVPDIDAETVKKFQSFFNSILVGLNTPHLNIALYRRCLHLMFETHEFSHANNWAWGGGSFSMLSFIYEGGFIGLLQLVRGFLSGLFDDQALLADLEKMLERIFSFKRNLELVYIAHQLMPGGNILLLLTDFSRQILQKPRYNRLADPLMESALHRFFNHYDYECQNQQEEDVIRKIPVAMIDVLSAWTETATTYLESDPELYPLRDCEEEELNKYLDRVDDVLAKLKA
tara:strand:- start:18975 stop:20237 length:1263 start_codon:yes stop_codon:yes gene_type:complete